MNQILTEDELSEIAVQEEFLLVCDGLDEFKEIARAIEQAILKKLNSAEPVAWVSECTEYNLHGERPILREIDYYNDVIDKLPAGTRLYLHPPAPVSAEPVAEVVTHKTGGNAGIAKHVHLLVHSDDIDEGAKLYTHPPAPSAVEWQPIETAPKDGTILLFAGTLDSPNDWRIKMGQWDTYDQSWYLFAGSWTPIYWQPLPKPPVAAARSEE